MSWAHWRAHNVERFWLTAICIRAHLLSCATSEARALPSSSGHQEFRCSFFFFFATHCVETGACNTDAA